MSELAGVNAFGLSRISSSSVSHELSENSTARTAIDLKMLFFKVFNVFILY
jgi:hypothetical protein